MAAGFDFAINVNSTVLPLCMEMEDAVTRNQEEFMPKIQLMSLILAVAVALVSCPLGGISPANEWTEPVAVGPEGNFDGNAITRVVMDETGNTLVAWTQGENGFQQIFISEYRDGVWRHPSGPDDNLSQDDATAIVSMEISMDDNGNAIIVWISQYADWSRGMRVFMSELRNGIWSAPLDISLASGAEAENCWHVGVEMDNAGNAVILWTQHDAVGDPWIFKSEFRNGVWTHPDSIDDHVNDGWTPRAAMNDSGAGVVVWAKSDGTGIWGSRYETGVWAEPEQISAESADECGAPVVEMDEAGNIIAAWFQPGGVFGDLQIYKNEFRAGTWGVPEQISQSAYESFDLQIEGNDPGDMLIVWSQYIDMSFSELYKSEFRGGEWNHPVNADDCMDSFHGVFAKAAMDGEGDSVIVWETLGPYRVYRCEFRNGSWIHPTGDDDCINSITSDASKPAVAMSGAGDAVMVFIQYEGPAMRLYISERRE
ncbi:MAG: hypothetical protein JW904_00740 [Spirochaetales bacterium]|nr:hypothetical protein [Spirochaetales bacterium]